MNLPRIIISIVFVIFSGEQLFSQVSADKIKSALIFHIINNITWPNEKAIDTFSIEFIGDNSVLFNELKLATTKVKFKDKPLRIRIVKRIDTLSVKQVIIVDENLNQFIPEIYYQCKGSVLLITQNSQNQLFSMVDIVGNSETSTISFTVNKDILESKSFTYTSSLLIYGGSVLDLKRLYKEAEKEIDVSKLNLLTAKQQLLKLEKDKTEFLQANKDLMQKKNDLEHSMDLNLKQLVVLKKSIQDKERLFKLQNLKYIQQKSVSDTLESDLRSKLNELEQLNKYLSNLKSEISRRENIIDDQTISINKKEEIIRAQRNFVFLTALVIGLLLITVFLFIRAYRIKRNINKYLEEQIALRTQELQTSRQYFKNLFEYSPISKWIEDITDLKDVLFKNEIYNEKSLQEKLNQDESFLYLCLSKIKIDEVNAATLNLFEVKSKDELVANFQSLMSPSSLRIFKKLLISILTGENDIEYEVVYRTYQTRKIVRVLFRWIILPDESKGRTKILITMADITALKKIEIELNKHKNHLEEMVKRRTATIAELNESLLKQKNSLEETLAELKNAQMKLIESEKMASLGMLTAGIAHEINNPINFISSGIQAMDVIFDDFVKKNSENSNEQLVFKSFVSDMNGLKSAINLGVQRTTEIINSLKNYTNNTTDEFTLYNIEDALQSSLVILNNQYKNRIEIKLEIAAQLPPIYCLPGKINQVFLNILSNAIDSIKNEGVITVKLDKQHSYIEVSIKDSGMGISVENQHKIFDPFFTTKEVGKGTGLGMYIVYNIIKKHNGSINLKSDDNGTEFLIRLPINPILFSS